MYVRYWDSFRRLAACIPLVQVLRASKGIEFQDSTGQADDCRMHLVGQVAEEAVLTNIITELSEYETEDNITA